MSTTFFQKHWTEKRQSRSGFAAPCKKGGKPGSMGTLIRRSAQNRGFVFAAFLQKVFRFLKSD
ncbi:MAG: hypothetical protein LUG58_06725 [Clostridiales bacterium]|nr:hypothetical protein [Clostridiales bacterium]MCD7830115.1 hypothetical protein [Clostridiales bacterium]